MAEEQVICIGSQRRANARDATMLASVIFCSHLAKLVTLLKSSERLD